MEQLILGVIGGSGLYEMDQLEQVEQRQIETPFGPTSSPITIGSIEGMRVAFLARHGIGHFISPSEVNYRANIYALKMLGVKNVIGISACGSLREDYEPGHFVVPDQLIDFTRRRESSFFGNGLVVHVGVAQPFCPALSDQLRAAASAAGANLHPRGSFITIEGPRFSTRGESNLFRSWSIDIIGMTTAPEAFLAREAEMCYAVLAHITDYDVWHDVEAPVSVDMVIETLAQNTATAKATIVNLLKLLPNKQDCDCDHALRDAFITPIEKVPAEVREKLAPMLEKYIK